ncbi:MAG: cupin-like domain-containing protein [Porticoccaceae bacterium]|nr:cupin-like domain-containing protein [Porticoccaceae bacterium]MDG1312369.1 cupin-like domain-containing protein [Porticoccaceae bacterium]
MLGINQQVQERTGCQPDSIPAEVVNSSVPLVLRGLVADWPLVQEAQKSAQNSISYLEKFDSGAPLTAFLGPAENNGRVFYNEDYSGFNYATHRVNLSQVFERLTEYQNKPEAPMLYVGSTMIDQWLPGFREHNDLALSEHNPVVSIWLGNRSRIAAHYDFPTNIACCGAGRRRVTLFPPEQLENLYVGPLDFTPAGQPISLVDFAQPDYERFPNFREALKVAMVVELEPGDALLIPSMWWHHIEALESFNLLVNYWWRNSPAYMGPPLNVLQHAIMGLRDLPPEQRAVWQQLFDHYVFNPEQEAFAHIPEQVRGVLNSMDEASAKQIRTMLLNKFKQ